MSEARGKTGIVVVSHGNAADAMVAAAERVLGKLDVRQVNVEIGEPRQVTEAKLEEAVKATGLKEILFLVDLEGSTPFNVCCRNCGGHSTVLSGMNLAMLFKLATTDRTVGSQALAEELRATGVKSIHVRPGGAG